MGEKCEGFAAFCWRDQPAGADDFRVVKLKLDLTQKLVQGSDENHRKADDY